MLYKTKGIVINYIKYRDTSIIVKVYTESFGLQSYIVNSIRSKSKKPKIALYQPLTLLDLVVYYKESVPIHRISEIKCDQPLHSLPYDFKKSCIGIFLTEILSKTIKEEESNPDLFEFLAQSIIILDNMNKGFENFHLQFLLALTPYLGFSPSSADSILEELYQKKSPSEDITKQLDALINSTYTSQISINNQSRREILEILLKFYDHHVEGFGSIRSVEVLKELMS